MTDQVGNGALHFAAEGGHIEVAKLLLAQGAKTNAANASGSFPLHFAPIGHPIRILLGATGAQLLQTTVDTCSDINNNININKNNINVNINNESNEQSSGPPGFPAAELNLEKDVHIAFRNKYQQDLALGPRDFEFVKVLGRGAFAKVYLVRGKGSNHTKWYALKAYNKQAVVQKNQARYIHTEKAALQACSDHPFIVTLHYAFQSKDRIFLVMDYCGGGDLLSALTRRKCFTESESCFYIAEIVLALVHLHSKNIVFRDLKPENVVMDMDGHCLLTDFGISKEGVQDHSSANTFCGSPMYLAPEMLTRSGHGFALDWYSVGALLYELLTGLPPYYANDKKQLFHNILKGNLPIPDNISTNARSILHGLLNRDPSKRLGSGPRGNKEIMEHPFFTNINWQMLYERKLEPPFKPQTTGPGTDLPDISNFPLNFTDQVISDSERGIESPTSKGKANATNQNRQFFEDFDFTPQLALNKEAEEFEKMALGMETKSNSKPRRKSNGNGKPIRHPGPPPAAPNTNTNISASKNASIVQQELPPPIAVSLNVSPGGSQEFNI